MKEEVKRWLEQATEDFDMSETVLCMLGALAQSKQTVSEHAQEHAPCFSTAVLDTAEVNFKCGKYYVTALFCQQAIEKALKALWLKEKTEEMPYVHDLTFLSKRLGIPSEYSLLCKELTTAYAETRYPDSSEIIPSKKFLEADAQTYLVKSKSLLAWIKKRIL